jgi:hypothetical protein
MSVKRLVPLNAPVLEVLPQASREGDIVYLNSDSSLYLKREEDWALVGTGAGGSGMIGTVDGGTPSTVFSASEVPLDGGTP